MTDVWNMSRCCCCCFRTPSELFGWVSSAATHGSVQKEFQPRLSSRVLLHSHSHSWWTRRRSGRGGGWSEGSLSWPLLVQLREETFPAFQRHRACSPAFVLLIEWLEPCELQPLAPCALFEGAQRRDGKMLNTIELLKTNKETIIQIFNIKFNWLQKQCLDWAPCCRSIPGHGLLCFRS